MNVFFSDPTANVNLLSLFFNFESAMEGNLSRGLVSTSKKYELGNFISVSMTLVKKVWCLS